MNITITQDNSRVEVLGSNGASIIEKLYELAIDPTNTLTLEGQIYTPYAYGYQVDYLNTNYGPDFKVTVDGKYIRFEDPNVITHLSQMNIGTNGMVTEDQAAAVTVISNIENNNTVTKFNELRYFTNVTEGYGGWNSSSDGSCKFLNWTALEEINISNFTSIGHGNRNSYGDTFRGCTSLKKVTASSKLKKLGFCAFCYCSNLEEISGLTGTIQIEGNAFHDCNKLKQSSIQNCTFTYSFSNGYDPQEMFRECWAITSVSLDPSMTILPIAMFFRCSNLTTVSGLDNITHYREQAFRYCSNFEGPLDLSNVVSIGFACFDGCEKVSIDAGTISSAITAVESYAFNECKRLTGIINLPNLTSLGQAAFSNCSNITAVQNLGSVTSIPDGCFMHCDNLTSVVFPQSLTSVESSAFLSCSHLDHVILPQSVTSIKKMAFYNCSSLRYIIIPTSQTITFTNGGQTFLNVPSNCVMYVDDNKVSEVQASNEAAGYGNFPGTIKGISDFTTDFPNG